MATHEVTPMALGERRVINGVEHVCVAIPLSPSVTRLPTACGGCPRAYPSGERCDELTALPPRPLCSYRHRSNGPLHRVYPLTLIATLAMQGVEFLTSDPDAGR